MHKRIPPLHAALLLTLALVLPNAHAVAVQSPATVDALRTGQWIEVRLASDVDRPTAKSVELLEPQDYEELLGTVPSGQRRSDVLLLLGQEVHLSNKTDWAGLVPGPLGGMRVKIEGRYSGPRNFSARNVKLRKPGSDRVLGRIDRITAVSDGIDLDVLSLTIHVPDGLALRHEAAIDSYPITPAPARLDRLATVEEDDQFGLGFELLPGLRLSGQLELRLRNEAEYDLDWATVGDRHDLAANSRLRLDYQPFNDLELALEWRHGNTWREDEPDPSERIDSDRLGQAYVRATDLFGVGNSMTLGRQDFDDPREWLYDQNLDGLRLEHSWGSAHLELAWTTTLVDGSPRDQAANNLTSYLSNRDRNRHLAAYVVHRDFNDGFDEQRTNAGLRAIGEFLPNNDSWLELGWSGGDEAGENFDGLALDLGTVWDLGPVKLVGGFAWASGDDDPSDGTNHAFRQTGLQDNNAKLGGVTSMRYYGEVLDPELSNLQILTAGLVLDVSEKESAAVIWHAYEQAEAADQLRDSDIDMSPSGFDTDIGWEIDLVLSSRRFANWDVELVAGYFDPGGAFPFGQAAALYQVQVRYRF